MPRKPPPEPDGDDLLTLLAEQEHGPLPCPHRFSAGSTRSGGWVHDTDPDSPYYLEYVHYGCGRSATPGEHKVPVPAEGWDPDLQMDVAT